MTTDCSDNYCYHSQLVAIAPICCRAHCLFTVKATTLRTHQEIDARLLAMVRACVEKIDANPGLLARLRANADRIADSRIRSEWLHLTRLPWEDLRRSILSQSPEGDQLRQNAPLGGVLTNAERFQFFRPKVPGSMQ